jgi:hypothetical protein
VPVAIGRGENRGRTITYHNVVRRWLKLGDWTGHGRDLERPDVRDQGTDDVDAAAVMVQEGTHDKPGIILGAAYAPDGRQPGSLSPQHRPKKRLPTRPSSRPNVRRRTKKKKAGIEPYKPAHAN